MNGEKKRRTQCARRVDNRPQGFGGNLSHFNAYLHPERAGHCGNYTFTRSLNSDESCNRRKIPSASCILGGHEVFHLDEPSRSACGTCSPSTSTLGFHALQNRTATSRRRMAAWHWQPGDGMATALKAARSSQARGNSLTEFEKKL